MVNYILELLSPDVTVEDALEHLHVHETLGGKNNKIIIAGKICKSCQIKIIFTGSNSTLYLGEECNYRGSIRIDTNGNIKIGKDFRGTNNVSLLCRPNKSIIIGDHCLFASSIVVRTSDEHSIYSLDTGELINPNRDVYIGDSVWVCDNVTILKGSFVGRESVIGAGSVVSGKIPKNVVVAGNPTKILKTNIVWSHEKPL